MTRVTNATHTTAGDKKIPFRSLASSGAWWYQGTDWSSSAAACGGSWVGEEAAEGLWGGKAATFKQDATNVEAKQTFDFEP